MSRNKKHEEKQSKTIRLPNNKQGETQFENSSDICVQIQKKATLWGA
jgi:hypothetical protein